MAALGELCREAFDGHTWCSEVTWWYDDGDDDSADDDGDVHDDVDDGGGDDDGAVYEDDNDSDDGDEVISIWQCYKHASLFARFWAMT